MSSSDLPTKHRALVATSDKTVQVREKELPTLSADDVLVQVKGVTLNPTDWKHVAGLLKDGTSTGSDFAGVVVRPDEGGKWRKGDRVAGFTRGGYLDNVRDRGGCRQSTLAEAEPASSAGTGQRRLLRVYQEPICAPVARPRSHWMGRRSVHGWHWPLDGSLRRQLQARPAEVEQPIEGARPFPHLEWRDLRWAVQALADVCSH